MDGAVYPWVLAMEDLMPRLKFSGAALGSGDRHLKFGPVSCEFDPVSVLGLYDLNLLSAQEIIRWFVGAPPEFKSTNRTGDLLLNGVSCAGTFKSYDCAYVSYAAAVEFSGFADNPADELAVSLELSGVPWSQIEPAIDWHLNVFGLSGVRESNLGWLSGGQKQRLAIASSLIMNPSRVGMLSILAELDPSFRRHLIQYLRFLSETIGSTFIISTYTGEVDESVFGQVLSDPNFIGHVGSTVTSTFRPAVDSSKDEVLATSLHSFRYKRAKIPTLSNMAFDLNRGELLFIVGENGTGKTTFAKILSATTPEWRTYAGSIRLLGRELSGFKPEELWSLISYAPQDPTDYFSRSTVRREFAAYRSAAIVSFEEKLIEVLGLTEVLDKNPYDLGPVERKKVSFVIAARSAPTILLLDEPTQYQDYPDLKKLVQAMDLTLSNGTSILCITHDERLLQAFRFARRHAILYNSSVSQIGMDSGARNPTARPIARTSVGKYFQNPKWRPSGSSRSKLVTLLQRDWEQQFPAWSRAFLNILDNWNRKQYPLLNNVFDALVDSWQGNEEPLRYVDFGCGNGWQTAYTARALRERGIDVQAAGFDLSARAIKSAKALFNEGCHISFGVEDCAEDDLRKKVAGRSLSPVNLITGYFLLHDTLHPLGLLTNASKLLADGGWAIFSMINPLWIEESIGQKEIRPIVFRTEEGDENCACDWVGEFQIQDSSGGAALVPYFHRSLNLYEELFRSVSMQLFRILWVADGKIIERQPFSAAWEWTTEVPSNVQSILLVCRKLSS
jgi:energy-coupling factor transporter ATP-binding protein EcfA2/SAM-dependent methyltransferase